MEDQEKLTSKSMAIARCYPMKNRDQHLMPCKWMKCFILQSICTHESLQIKRWLISEFLNLSKLQLKIHSNQTTAILNCVITNAATAMQIISKYPEEPAPQLHVSN